MITYNDLYEALRKERYNEQLQILPRGFVQDVADYFKDKREMGDKESDLFSDIAIKAKKKLENAIMNFRELIRIRRKKILNLAFVAAEVGISKKDFENLLSFEKDLFEDVVKSLERSEKGLGGLMSGTKDENKHRLVRFLEDVDAFLDFDGNEIGPFKKTEVANLDKEIVNILEKDSRVEVIDED